MTLPARMAREYEPPVEWTLADLIQVLLRRRAWILGAILLCCAAAILKWAMETPRYRATATIEVRTESRGGFGLDRATSDRKSSRVNDSFDENLDLQTEIGILRSDAVALDAIRQTGLEGTRDYFGRGAREGSVRRLEWWRKPLEPLSVPLAEAPNRRYAALKIFASHCRIAPAAGTRLISISYSDPNPRRAAAVVNALLASLAENSFRARSSAAEQSAAWLQAQLTGLEEQTDALDARAAALDRAAGDYGDDQGHNVVLTRLDALNSALSAAESRRIVREAIWRAVQSGDAGAISGLAGNAEAGANTQNSLALLQTLRAKQAVAASQLAEESKRYGAKWPAMVEERARMAALDEAVQKEVQRLHERAHSDYEIAVQEENAARDAFSQQKELASRVTGDAVALRLVRQEAEQSRALYTSLLGRLQQTGVLEGLHSGNFTVVSPAMVPAPDHPANPGLFLLLAMAVAAGTVLGSVAAVARELTDDAVRNTAELEALLESPVLAALPERVSECPWYRRSPGPRGATLPVLEGAMEPKFGLPVGDSGFTDALQRLRASLLVSHSARAPQVITLTRMKADQPEREWSEENDDSGAGLPLALSLAAILAQHGDPVLYIDADLRSAPARSGSSEPGLSELLASDGVFEGNDEEGSPLSVIRTGPRPPYPSELIASRRMAGLLAAWRERYRFIVIHGPAAEYADALVLAQLSDAVLVSARSGRTRKAELMPAYAALSRQVPDHAVLSLVLEGVSRGGAYARA